MAGKPTKAKRTTVRKAGKTPGGNLVPQKHGGAIHQGAPANPVAGPGRPAEHIRADMRAKLDELLPDVLERYKAGDLDHVRVVEFLAKYGLGTKDEVDVNGTIQRVQGAMAQALAENVALPVQQRILERMAELVRG